MLSITRYCKCLLPVGNGTTLVVTLWLCQNSYWSHGPVEIVDLPINSMVIFHSYVSLPEGNVCGILFSGRQFVLRCRFPFLVKTLHLDTPGYIWSLEYHLGVWNLGTLSKPNYVISTFKPWPACFHSGIPTHSVGLNFRWNPLLGAEVYRLEMEPYIGIITLMAPRKSCKWDEITPITSWLYNYIYIMK